MSLIFLASMFFLSFMPLWISVSFIDIMSLLGETENIWTEKIVLLAIVIAFIISVIVLIVTLKNKNTDTEEEYILLSAKRDKTISVEFLLSYILPLFAFDFTKWKEVVLFMIFFFILGWLTIKHNRFTQNLLLEILEYYVYECEIENLDSKKTEIKVVSKNPLVAKTGSEIYLVAINNEFRIDRTVKAT